MYIYIYVCVFVVNFRYPVGFNLVQCVIERMFLCKFPNYGGTEWILQKIISTDLSLQ